MATSSNSGDLSTATNPVAITHPVYQVWAPIWRKLAHVREGVGGFLDGTYLVAHPREWEDYTAETPVKPTKKLKARRHLASYENFASTLIESKKSALFRTKATRRIGDPKSSTRGSSDLERWWQNVDGLGTSIDDFMALVWDPAATFGHIGMYLDRSAGAAPTLAVDTRMPFVRVYTPLDIPDWLQNDMGGLTAIKFLEAVPRTTLETVPRTNQQQTRTVTEQCWTLYDQNHAVVGGGPGAGDHQMGVLPVVVLYGRRRPLLPLIGQSVVGDPQNHIDLYNLVSEVRELLRNQTFSFINLPLGTGPDRMSVDDAKTMMGSQTGTSNVVFSALPALMLSADAANVKTYHDELERKIRQIYREAGVPWEADSKAAQAKGSLQLKREELNTRLASYASECQEADIALAKLFYRAYYGAEEGPKRYEADRVSIEYPDTFDITPFDDVLNQAQSAIAIGMPTEVLKAIRKQLLQKFLPEASPEELTELEAAIDAATADLTPDQRLKVRAEQLANAGSRFGGKTQSAQSLATPAPLAADTQVPAA